MLDSDYFSKEIVQELKAKDPDKYKYLTVKSVNRHIRIINWILTRILKTRNHAFKSKYFELKPFHLHWRSVTIRKKYYNKIMNDRISANQVKDKNDYLVDINGVKSINYGYWKTKKLPDYP